jgi:hypothetical protein
MKDWRGVNGWMSWEANGTVPLPNDHGVDAEDEINAPMIFFKNSRPYDIPGIENSFPNQKIPIKMLLAEEPDANPLMQPCEDNVVRYFHLPANNMIWVEVSLSSLRISWVFVVVKREPKQRCFLRQSFGRASSILMKSRRFMLVTCDHFAI